MKLIVAYIQPEKLNDVKQELYRAEILKLSVTNALGCGQQGGYHESYRGVDVEVNLLKKVRLEIAVNDFLSMGGRQPRGDLCGKLQRGAAGETIGNHLR